MEKLSDWLKKGVLRSANLFSKFFVYTYLFANR